MVAPPTYYRISRVGTVYQVPDNRNGKHSDKHGYFDCGSGNRSYGLDGSAMNDFRFQLGSATIFLSWLFLLIALAFLTAPDTSVIWELAP
jgi:hypothetical protein